MSGLEVGAGDDGDGAAASRPAIETVLLPALFDSSDVALLAIDAAGLITAVSPGAERLLAYDHSDLVGWPLHATVHPQRPDGSLLDEADCPIVAALAAARPAEGMGEVLLRSDGTMVTVAWALAPVVLAGWRTGAVLAFFDPDSAPGPANREVARLSALYSASTRLSLLADATHTLVTTADLREGLTAFGRLLVPTLADWVVIDLLDTDSSVLERAALVHRDPALERIGLSSLGTLPPPIPGSDNALARVLAGGPIERITSFSEGPGGGHDPLRRARSELFAALGSADALTAPLRTRTRTVGALTVVRSNPRRPYSVEDAALVAELGGRIAFVVENAWLFERLQRRAEEMQRALLPSLPPRLGDVELAGVYRPADDVSQLGGDWYDAFPLRDGTVAVVIGDVAGHDLHAATRMGAIRHKLRAVASDRMAPPSEVLARVDAILADVAPEDLVTTVYSRLLPGADGWWLEWSSAGHPPPLLIDAGGRPSLMEGAPDPPLGAPAPERHDHRARLEPGSRVVLYTDGLFERTDQALDQGLRRLVAAASGAAPGPVRDLCQALVDAMPVQGIDDVAVLGLAVPPTVG